MLNGSPPSEPQAKGIQTSVAPWLYWSLLPIHRLLLPLYFNRILIYGSEHLPASGPVVLAPKHFSRWDPVVLAVLSLEPLWFMTNANQFSGFQGWFIRHLGAFPVNLDRPQLSSFRMAIDLLQSGRKLMLFPEGGIVRDQRLRPLKPGLARLVLQAESAAESGRIPIVPIALRYRPEATWRADVLIQVCPPLVSETYRQETDRQTAVALTHALQTALLEGLNQLHGVTEDRK